MLLKFFNKILILNENIQIIQWGYTKKETKIKSESRLESVNSTEGWPFLTIFNCFLRVGHGGDEH